MDTSALFKRYQHEEGTALVSQILETPDQPVFISALSIVEIISNLKRLFEVDKITDLTPKSVPAFRGHHLICLHFFSGEGYTQDFVENLSSILDAAHDEGLEVCHGADDICRKCPHLKDDICQYTQNADKEINTMDNRALKLLNAVSGNKLVWHQIKESLPGIFQEWHKAYCTSCGWKPACEKNDSYRQLICTLTP